MTDSFAAGFDDITPVCRLRRICSRSTALSLGIVTM